MSLYHIIADYGQMLPFFKKKCIYDSLLSITKGFTINLYTNS